jgi:hypothetical protein
LWRVWTSWCGGVMMQLYGCLASEGPKHLHGILWDCVKRARLPHFGHTFYLCYLLLHAGHNLPGIECISFKSKAAFTSLKLCIIMHGSSINLRYASQEN